MNESKINYAAGSRSALIQQPRCAITVFGAERQDAERVPWYATMRRCGQTNFNERDPIELDIDWWVRCWSSLKLDALLLNAGGIMAFYPTEIPYHHRSQFLGNRDLFGDFHQGRQSRKHPCGCPARLQLRIRRSLQGAPGMVRANAAMESPSRTRNRRGSTRPACSPPISAEQMPAIIREVNSLYDVDGFFTNGWPSTGQPAECSLRSMPETGGSGNAGGLSKQHMARVLEIWKLWDSTAKQKKWDSVYVGNLGGGIRAVTNLSQIARCGRLVQCRPPGAFRQDAHLGLRAAGPRGASGDEGPHHYQCDRLVRQYVSPVAAHVESSS